MSELTSFVSRAAEKARDEVHRRKITKAVATYDAAVTNTKADQFRDWQEAHRATQELNGMYWNGRFLK